eukprot:CAMPEP_0172064352 /NCGR_PEP_ID=MMETSP1043-20130122/10057_1 /TAXON_ID=464988 /ORGANISM="Hemiselmis andersenii, Strain CCMP441" /LENGTH=492 /DNA_ID=CAMNT_0012724389 /DNA_START=135 /DNA_END=1609 /DNA_ORIENTATION=-
MADSGREGAAGVVQEPSDGDVGAIIEGLLEDHAEDLGGGQTQGADQAQGGDALSAPPTESVGGEAGGVPPPADALELRRLGPDATYEEGVGHIIDGILKDQAELEGVGTEGGDGSGEGQGSPSGAALANNLMHEISVLAGTISTGPSSHGSEPASGGRGPGEENGTTTTVDSRGSHGSGSHGVNGSHFSPRRNRPMPITDLVEFGKSFGAIPKSFMNGDPRRPNGESPEKLCKESVHAAALYGDLENLERLILTHTHEAKDKIGFTPLHFAACYGQHQVLDWLIERGSDVGSKNDVNWTPLHVAARNGHLDCVVALLARGADVNAVDAHGWTPLHNGCCSSNLAVTNKLLQVGARVDVKDSDGWTALHFATRFNNVDIIEALLDAGADVDVQDVDGWTALHNSARNGRNRCVNALLDRGASVLVKTRYGETPLHVACRKGKAKVVQEIVSFSKRAQQRERGLFGQMMAATNTEGRTPEQVASSEYIRSILRG